VILRERGSVTVTVTVAEDRSRDIRAEGEKVDPPWSALWLEVGHTLYYFLQLLLATARPSDLAS
jgi:hypothetical protein